MPLLQTRADASAWGYGFLGATASIGNFYQISQLSPSAVSTVTFSSIPSTYKSLQVRFNLVTSATSQSFKFQFNSDTSTSNYANHWLFGTASTAGATGNASGVYGYILVADSGSLGTYPNVGIVDIIDYANANKNKTVKSFVGANQNTSTGYVELGSGVWLSTAAITSLTIAIPSGTFTGTITLYGAN